MQRLLERLNGLSVDGYSCRQDMEEEFDHIFSEINAAGKKTNFPAVCCTKWPKRTDATQKLTQHDAIFFTMSSCMFTHREANGNGYQQHTGSILLGKKVAACCNNA